MSATSLWIIVLCLWSLTHFWWLTLTKQRWPPADLRAKMPRTDTMAVLEKIRDLSAIALSTLTLVILFVWLCGALAHVTFGAPKAILVLFSSFYLVAKEITENNKRSPRVLGLIGAIIVLAITNCQARRTISGVWAAKANEVFARIRANPPQEPEALAKDPEFAPAVQRCCATGVLIGVAALLSGCAHSRLYDENSDKQAQAAVKAVEDAHLSSTVESMSKAFAEMAAREESSARDRIEQMFEWEMIRVSRARSLDSKFKDNNTDVDGLATTVKTRLQTLGLIGDSDDKLKELRTNQVLLQTDTALLANKRYTFLGAFGVAFTACGEIYANSADPAKKSDRPSTAFLQSLKEEHRTTAPLQFKELVENCTLIDSEVAGRNALFSDGVIADLFVKLDKKTYERAAYKAVRAKAVEDLVAATKSAEPAIRNATPGEPRLAEVEKAADKVLGVIGQARAINEIAGAEVLAKEKLDRLEALLGAIAGAPAKEKVNLSVDQLVGVELVRTLPSLADEADKLLAEAGKPRLVPFLAAIEYQKLVLERIDAVNKSEEKEISALRNQLQATIDEAVALARVRQPIQQHRWNDRSIAQLDQQLKDTDKRTLYALLATYGDEVRQKRIDGAVWKSRALAAGYERELVNSKYAALQWDALMDMTAKVLADYHAAGIKPSDLTDFFKALGLVAIGIGITQ